MKSNWEVSHLGLCVKDFDKTIEYFQSLGLAPDRGRTQNPFTLADKNLVTHLDGSVRPFAAPGTPYFLQLLYVGDLEVEVLRAPAEPPKGDALIKREGINHICFKVPDIDGETDILAKKGFRIVLDFISNGVRIEDYFDTREFGNVCLSLRPLQSVQEEPNAVKATYAIVNWKFRGLDIVVKDVEKTASYYESIGVATIQPETTFDTSSMADVKVNGKNPESAIKAKTRAAQIGPLVYEFIQPVEGQGIYKESLDRRGEGVITLTYSVDDLGRETAKLVEKGVPVIFSGKPQTGGAFAYLDTREHGGDIMIKLVQRAGA